MTLWQIFEKLKGEHARSLEKHGKWVDMPEQKQLTAIHGEFSEWFQAQQSGDVEGEHGEIEELVDLMNVAARRIMYLSGEDQ